MLKAARGEGAAKPGFASTIQYKGLLARDGLLPPWAARLHPKYRTPHVTTIITGVLVALGACAITGGLPAQRNHLDLGLCLQEVYLTEPSLARGGIPNDPELPLPFDKVHPIGEVVKVTRPKVSRTTGAIEG